MKCKQLFQLHVLHPTILKYNYNASRLQRVRLQGESGYNEQVSCIKIIDHRVKKFGYNEHPLITSGFYCIFLLVSVTQLVESTNSRRNHIHKKLQNFLSLTAISSEIWQHRGRVSPLKPSLFIKHLLVPYEPSHETDICICALSITTFRYLINIDKYSVKCHEKDYSYSARCVKTA